MNPEDTAKKGRRSRPLSSAKKTVFSTAVVCSLLLLFELALNAVGVQPQYLSVDPFVGFRPGSPLFLSDGGIYRTSPTKRMFFNDQQFLARKPANTYRIFCLGGSTTFGHPYDDTTSFCGWLRARLKDAEPDRHWEVINCGGISYASYRICRLMQELNAYEPDMFIFYEGHNEFLEERTYGDFKQRSLVTRVADLFVTRTRIGTALASLKRPHPSSHKPTMMSSEVDTILEHSVGPEKYHRDPVWRAAVIHHFQESLERAWGISASAGARIIFVKPAANLRDFTPFKNERGAMDSASLNEWSTLVTKARTSLADKKFAEAATNFVAATKLDPHYAKTHWDAGGALLQAGHKSAARDSYQRAVDEDVCPLRAVSEIQAAMEQVAQKHQVPLIDFPKLIEDEIEPSLGHRIPGDESFLDHVHPTIENNRKLAWALYDQLVLLQVVRGVPSDSNVIERISTKVLKDLDAKKQAQALVQVAQVLSWAGKNTEAIHPIERAEELCPGLADVAFYRGRLHEKSGEIDEAFRWYREAITRNPQDYFALSHIAELHGRRGESDMALEYYQQAIRFTPEAAPASFRCNLHVGLGLTYVSMNRRDDALSEFQMALQIAPSSAEAAKAMELLRGLK